MLYIQGDNQLHTFASHPDTRLLGSHSHQEGMDTMESNDAGKRWEKMRRRMVHREAMACKGRALIHEGVLAMLRGEPELGLKLVHLAELAFAWGCRYDDK